jgi:hypothetical protein
METAFLVCAILGGTFLICQVVAGLVGFGLDTDADTDTDVDSDADSGGDHGDGFLGMLTVRTISAAILFFGLGGMTALYYEAEGPAVFGLALLAGAAAFYGVAMIMKSLAALKADGTARVERSVGLAATVYLRIPAGRVGQGKVHLMLQNRTVEYQAVTAGAELPTGAQVKVVAVVNSDTVEVEAA